MIGEERGGEENEMEVVVVGRGGKRIEKALMGKWGKELCGLGDRALVCLGCCVSTTNEHENKTTNFLVVFYLMFLFDIKK